MKNLKISCSACMQALGTMLLLLASFSGIAQDVNRLFNFTVGDEYIKEVKINSNGVVERGKQKLSINTVSNITKSFKVIDSSSAGYTFRITINEMTNQIELMDQKLNFDSKKPIDQSSSIEKALRFMVDKPVELQIDKRGTILSVTDPTSVLANDSLLAFAGIQPEFFERGDLFSLVGDIIYSPRVKKGYVWKDSVVIDLQKMVTEYRIEDLNEKTTIVKLKTNSTGRMINSNTTATYIADNKSGLIIEKLIYTISTGYRVANKVIYGTSRSTSMSETVHKKSAGTAPPPTAKLRE